MSKIAKTWLVIATFLVIVGLMMFTVVMSKYNWDFTKLNTKEYETNVHKINEEFNNISVNADTTDIVFALSDNGECVVKCFEDAKAKHSVIVQENTLIINVVDKTSWYDHIGIAFSAPTVTIYLPKTEYSSFFVETSTGDIHVENISMDECNLSTSTGDTNLTDIECKNLISSGETGDISLSHVIATKKITIKRDTGDVSFDDSDAAEFFVETDTGDVTGNLLTDKVFITHTATGRIDVPKTSDGGRCEIDTDTGDIVINIQ